MLINIWFFLLSSCMRTSTSRDSLGINESLRDGETLVSSSGSFELGFFSPGASTNRYVGVSYRDASKNPTIVWVANRERPLHNTSGVLQFNEKGNLQLLNDTNNDSVWSSNTSASSKALNDSIAAQLLDSGNLIVKNKEGNILWQSFDYPCDTLMPGMKLGLNLVTGLDRSLSCWKSVNDPAIGEYSVKLDARGYPQVLQMKGSVIINRGGPWNGLYFSGYPYPLNIFTGDLVLNDREIYYTQEMLDKSIFSLYRKNPSGSGQLLVWTSQTRKQVQNTTNVAEDQCENYAFCGSNSICNMNGNGATCECLKGYVPKFPEQWNISFWSSGCVRKTAFNCNNTYGFLRYTDLKLPDTSSSWYSKTMTLKECQNLCLKNCSCRACANLDIRNGGSGCLLWFDHLVDMRQFFKGGQDLYIKVPASELANGHGNMKKKKVGIAVGVIIFGLITVVTIVMIKYPGAARKIYKNKHRQEDVDVPTFDISVLAKATNDFSSNNKLGEGGFGPVYKGTLTNGQELAVKRLSKNSRQGLEEFKNEVVLIANLQHRNLVKLLGCCVQGEEKMLIYEYMPNKSLDHFVFG